MFRNPTAHEVKIKWDLSEDDALDIMSLVSYCHRRLDKAHKHDSDNAESLNFDILPIKYCFT